MTDPKGIVMCFIAPDGHVVATATDFLRQGYGGFTLQEAQNIRCKRALAYAVVNALCSSEIVKVMDEFGCDGIISKMERHQGYRRHTIVVGHTEPDND